MDDERLGVVARIPEIVAGPADVGEIALYIHSDVIVNMDGIAFRGLTGWRKWIRFSRARSGLAIVGPFACSVWCVILPTTLVEGET